MCLVGIWVLVPSDMTSIPGNSDPSFAIEKICSHFMRMATSSCTLPEHLKVMILISKMPPLMTTLIQLICQTNDVEKLDVDKIKRMCHDFRRFSPLFLILSFIFFWSFRLEGELGHLGLLGLETFGPWEDSTKDYLFWSDVDIPYKGVDPSLGSLLRLGHQPLLLFDVPHARQPLLPIPTRLNPLL